MTGMEFCVNSIWETVIPFFMLPLAAVVDTSNLLHPLPPPSSFSFFSSSLLLSSSSSSSEFLETSKRKMDEGLVNEKTRKKKGKNEKEGEREREREKIFYFDHRLAIDVSVLLPSQSAFNL